jgi:hypothetical protein
LGSPRADNQFFLIFFIKLFNQIIFSYIAEIFLSIED